MRPLVVIDTINNTFEVRVNNESSEQIAITEDTVKLIENLSDWGAEILKIS